MNPLSAIRAKKPRRPVSSAPSPFDRPVQVYRRWVQIGFALLCVWIGIEFTIFVKYLESGGTTLFVPRPPGVEAFLPISSLMSLYYFLISGIIHPVHPAGLFILVAILVISWLFGKSFCSWVCPGGLLSETLGNIGSKIFKSRLALPRWLDYPLRSLKYLLLGFFVWAIFFAMSEAALRAFLDSPYNQVADVKMYYFFADISRLALIIIAGLFVLSLVIRNVWCRFLCPYGALLGILSLFSPVRIKRNAESCIDCGRCANACGSHIKVDQLKTVISDECSTCLACVDACPVSQTLQLTPVTGKRAIPRPLVALGVVGIFLVITGSAMLAGKWHNDVSTTEYLHHQQHLESYGHPRGAADIEDLNQHSTKEP